MESYSLSPTFGESHGPGLGAIIDGCPPGLPICEEDLQQDLDRRKPGQSRYTTQRREGDEVEILSGVFEGKTTGTPIGLLIRNMDQRSKDYGKIKDQFRPAHADYTYQQKYGFRDYRGGGRSSARETAMRVAAGAVAKKWLAHKWGISVRGYLQQIGPLTAQQHDWSQVEEKPLLLWRRRFGSRVRKFYASIEQKRGFHRCNGFVSSLKVFLRAGVNLFLIGSMQTLRAR